MAEFTKENSFQKLLDGKFQCLLCNKALATKQRALTHLHKVHDLSPVKRVKKRYLEDESATVPTSTMYRWKKQSNPELHQNIDYPNASVPDEQFSTERDPLGIDRSASTNVSENIVPATPESERTFQQSSPMSFDDYVDVADVESDISNCASDNSLSFDSNSESNESDISSLSDREISDSDSYSSCSSTDSLRLTSSIVEDLDEAVLPTEEFQSLSLVSCFLRNKFSAATCKDVIDTFKCAYPQCEELSNLDFRKLMLNIESDDIKEFHYCILCNKLFPVDTDIFRCDTPNCDGLRYKGSIAQQENTTGRQPNQSFVFTDVKKQLVSLLETPGIWKDIQENKEAAYERKDENTGVLTDITDGSLYREMMVEGGFLDKAENNITAIFNTDGVNLYSSSKIELWPIFVAINELSPSQRFSRNNILLVGMWQGKGKPPFQTFLSIFNQEMNALYADGVQVKINEKTFDVKLSVLCGIADLPAKAELLNMTYYNGEYGCVTCEEPGMSVPQGRGHARCFPYRGPESYPIRCREKILTNMETGTEKKRSQGFKGQSELINLKNYDIVKGTVPDYMHGVLLGVVKTLLSKWFSPSECQKNYFIGKNVKAISKRMKNIKPPNCIERLPRDLERHYLHFKATELQSWLLYYSIPCLKGFLEDEFMENLVCLSQAVYTLLSDTITPGDLEMAVDLLQQFYSSFQRLYGNGSCGLNIHNTALHLPYYVKLWGPVWCWSCFPFEDANAMLLQAAHGTGNVLKQVMKYRQAQLYICKKGMGIKKVPAWKTTEASNCDFAGAPQKLGETENWVKEELALLHQAAVSADKVKKIHRIIVNNTKFFSEGYGRMQKRTCNIVKYSNDNIGNIKFFALYEHVVYAIISKMEKIPFSQLPGTPVISHLTAVKDTETFAIVNVEDLIDVMVCIDARTQENILEPLYVCSLPNRYGHAVFK